MFNPACHYWISTYDLLKNEARDWNEQFNYDSNATKPSPLILKSISVKSCESNLSFSPHVAKHPILP
jgi:hypothetical protein